MNILLLGQETNFRPLLMEALKEAGHGWQFAATWENAVALIQQYTFGCVMLSYSLASDTIEEFIELLNQVCPACPIIAISEQDGMDWKLQPTTIVRADQDFEALVGYLADIEQRAGLAPHQHDEANTPKPHKFVRRCL